MATGFNYVRSAMTAKRLIEKYGRLAKITVVTKPSNPDKPWQGSVPVEAEVTRKMCFLKYEQKDIDETLIRSGDQKVLLAANGLTLVPNLSGYLTDSDGSLWNIVKIKPLNPGDTMVLYTLQVRQ